MIPASGILIALSIGYLLIIVALLHTPRGRSLVLRRARFLFLLGTVIVAAFAAYRMFTQYYIWKTDPLGQFLLPPYQEQYFFAYALSRVVLPHLVALLFALAVVVLVRTANKGGGGVFFERGEEYIAGLTVFLAGFPGLLFYIVALLLLYLTLHLIAYLRGAGRVRLPLLYLWVPTAAFVILINEYWLSHTEAWRLLSL